MNHIRSCGPDSGSGRVAVAGGDRGSVDDVALPAHDRLDRARPAPATVGCSNTARTGSSTRSPAGCGRRSGWRGGCGRRGRRSRRRCRRRSAPSTSAQMLDQLRPAARSRARRLRRARRDAVRRGQRACGRPCRWASAASASRATKAAGTMYAGQDRSQVVAQLVRGRPRPSTGHVVADEPHVAGRRLPRGDDRRRDPGMADAGRARSRRARSGSRGSSPGGRGGRGTRASPSASSRRTGRRSGRAARRVADERVGHEPLRGQLGPVAGSRARGRRRRCTARPARRPAPARRRPSST